MLDKSSLRSGACAEAVKDSAPRTVKVDAMRALNFSYIVSSAEHEDRIDLAMSNVGGSENPINECEVQVRSWTTGGFLQGPLARDPRSDCDSNWIAYWPCSCA